MTEANRRLRVGLIGLGMQGATHLQDFLANGQARIVALCDLKQDLLAQRSEESGVKSTFTDYREMLARDDVEAVVIAIPDPDHRGPAVDSIRAGKHVLLEKPMALTVEDARAIAAAAQESEKCFMVNLSNRWMPVFSRAHALVSSGELGAIRYVFSRMSNRIDVPTRLLPWLEDSHLAHWIGVHRLDIARWLIGREVVRVRALQRGGVLRSMGFDAPDFYQATLEFDGGAVMSLEGSWFMPATYPSMVDSKFFALCEKGVIDIDRLRNEFTVTGPERFDLGAPGSGPLATGRGGFTLDASRHFVDCCLSGAQPLVTAADGVALTRTLCALVQSAENDGEVVELSW